MSKLIPLRDTDLLCPDLSTLSYLANRLGGPAKAPVLFFGSYLRDAVLLGTTMFAKDIDAIMAIPDFLALKPTNPGQIDDRKLFSLHKPHLLHMLHLMKEDKFASKLRPVVLNLDPEHQHTWRLSKPLGLSLSHFRLTLEDIMTDCADFGISSIISDGTEIWVTEDFLEDDRNRTITMLRCQDTLDYERSQRRLEHLTTERYKSWTPIIPEHFQQFAPAA